MRNCIKCILISLLLVSCKSGPDDMIIGSWVEPVPGMNADDVQGFTLQKDGKAASINMYTLVYDKWEMFDKQTIILKGQSIGNGQTIEFSDTLKIERLDSDSLVLRQNDLYTRYGRR